jgi:anti-sigma regulatory factor (Ser/Thr protein kinase)
MKDFVTITIPSNPKYLSVVRSITVIVGQMNGMNEEVLEDIKLAVDEACANVIKHAYKGNTSGKIVIKYKTSPENYQVVITDNGIKAQNDLLKGRDLDDVRPGGLGVHLIKRVFDVFELDEKKKKGNRLILIKHLHQSKKALIK